ncbi:hypothetical protein I4U23_013662 [Adineta vaga]|nr:hypothetical protein I4U23_013662 [Adineta vaga]
MKDAVLILGGAFNPVHTQHIALFDLVKQELDAIGQWNIIGGYLAAAPENYVLHKLRARNERTIKLQHRLALVKEAMKNVPWLINSPFQEEMLKQHDGSATGLGRRLMNLFKNPNIQVLVLVGGDRMIKQGVPIWRRAGTKTSVMHVGVGRIMDENVNLLDLWQADLDKNLIHNPKDYVILNIPLRSVSSSMIRVYLQQWFDAKDNIEKKNEIENDLVDTNNYLHLNVMNYIKTHHNDLFVDI